MMKKSLIALAAMTAVGAHAQVTLSGRADVNYSTYSATGSVTNTNDYAQRGRIADGGSRITFAANEDLGGGLKAGVYCETGFNMDVATPNGQSNVASSTTSTSEWCAREGRLFIGNNTAELRLGRQNVWWTQGKMSQTASNLVGIEIASNLITGGSGGNFTRVDNLAMIQAGSALGGFAGSQIWMSIPTGQEAAAANTNPSSIAGNLTGLKLVYTADKFTFQFDQLTSLSNATSSTTNAFDRNLYRFGVAYDYAPGSLVSLQYVSKERKDLSTPNAYLAPYADTSTTKATGNAKESSFIINLNHALSQNAMVVAQYGRVNNLQTGSSNTELVDSGAVAYTLGGLYRLSKRTHVYAAYNTIQNGINNNFNISGSGQNSGTVYNGAQVVVTSVGLQHNF